VSTAHLILVMSVHLAALDHGVMDPALAALRAERQAAERIKAGDIWQDTGLVFTTSYDTPYEPRTFARRFALRCSKAVPAASGSMTPGARALRFWSLSTSIRGSRCRSSGTARSR
jgi:hypothetical protein